MTIEPWQAELLVFSNNYTEARQRFLAAARKRGTLESWEHGLAGPGRESLAIDCAWIGDPDASRVVVLVSGTHGVEGFSGSGIQVDWLMHAPVDAPGNDTAMLMIHGLNPWGFAWLRRVTEDGVDLNRNFIDFDQPFPRNTGYMEIADALVPPALDENKLAAAERKIRAYRAEHGEAALQYARKAGQYVDPKGVFFGGFCPAWSRNTLVEIADRFKLASRKALVVVDVHTGLGPYGYGELILKNAPETKSAACARAWFGRSVTEPARGSSTTPLVHGSASNFWTTLGPEISVFVVLEYGTFGTERGRMVLRDDHWLHAQGYFDWEINLAQAIKTALKEHYHPGTPDWNEMVLCRARQVLRQAAIGLAGL